MCAKKPIAKMYCYVLLCTDFYWFAHNISSSHSWVNPAMHETAWKLVTKWLRNPPSGNYLHVSPIYPYVSSCFIYCFPSFFCVFPMFPLVFLPVFFLGLTHSLFVIHYDSRTKYRNSNPIYGKRERIIPRDAQRTGTRTLLKILFKCTDILN